MTSLIDTTLADENIMYAAGSMETLHSTIGHKLTERDYQVSRHFVDKEKGVLLFPPIQEMIRRLILQPDRQITQAEWEIGLARECLWSFALPAMGKINYQTKLRKFWKSTKDMTIDDASKVETSAKQKNVHHLLFEYGLIDEPRDKATT